MGWGYGWVSQFPMVTYKHVFSLMLVWNGDITGVEILLAAKGEGRNKME